MKALFLALILVAIPASAGTLFSNFPGPFSDNSSTVGLSFFDLQAAVGFTAPNGLPYSITDVQMPLDYITGHQITPAQPILELRNDNSGNPGTTVLQTFLTPPVQNPGNEFHIYTFTAQGGFELQGGMSYWLVLRRTPGTSEPAEWQRTINDVMPTGPATNIHYKNSNDGGATWADSVVGDGLFVPFTNLANAIQVNATTASAPEPATLLLTALSLVALVGTRARRISSK
jgi:hypothetical protein